MLSTFHRKSVLNTVRFNAFIISLQFNIQFTPRFARSNVDISQHGSRAVFSAALAVAEALDAVLVEDEGGPHVAPLGALARLLAICDIFGLEGLPVFLCFLHVDASVVVLHY